MKKTLYLLALLMYCVFLLCSCSNSKGKIIPEQNINYTNFQRGNVIDDGEIAIYLNFDSSYTVSKLEIKGDLKDKNGNIIYSFDENTTFSDPSKSPTTIIFVDQNIAKNVSRVSFTKIKAYTNGALSNVVGVPSAVVPRQTNYVTPIIVMLILGAIFTMLPIIIIKLADDKNDKDNIENALLTDQDKKCDEILENSKIQKTDRQSDKFEEIKKYKELLDMGIITQEEFDAKKKELLG